MRCTVFLGASIDGFIARPDGALDWLPGADAEVGVDAASGADDGADDGGYSQLMAEVDALLMGRSTYDTVLGFGAPWPYELPVTVLTSRPLTAPVGANVQTEQGPIVEVLSRLEAAGVSHLYVDGGDVVQQALAADVIDSLIISTVPVLLGDGIRWAGAVGADLRFTVAETRQIAHGMTQTTWVRDRSA